jgi:hypothetical protein
MILLIIIGLFLPAEKHLERKTIIKAPAYIIFNQIDSLKNWERWSPWALSDTHMVSEYEGPSSGAGAICRWSSPNRQTGTGSMKILESNPNKSILIEVSFAEQGKLFCRWFFEENADETNVIWGLDMKNMNIAEKYFSLFLEGVIGPFFTQGLDSLKIVCERYAI